MIKLIASDMDGTLLNDRKELNFEIFDIINDLNKKGIIFAAASGRQLCSLNRFFEPVSDNIIFIAENGTFVSYKGEELYSSTMKKTLVTDILNKCDSIDPEMIILCGKYCAYTDSKDIFKMMSADSFKYNIKMVDSLFDVNDEILKISLADKNDVNNCIRKVNSLFNDRVDVTLSGYNCVDIMNKGENKGKAIKNIQKKLEVEFNETVVFGDNYNDIEMFEEAYYSFAMEAAVEGVRKRARFIAGDNNNDAVIKKIRELCL